MALFEHNQDKKYYCTLLYCTPLSSCEFVPNQLESYIVELKPANRTQAEQELEHVQEEEEARLEAIFNGEGMTACASTCRW